MMAGYRYYPEVGDPEDELDKAPSLLEVAAAGGATGGASDAPTTIASPGNVGGATTTSSPMALGDDFQYSEPVGGGIAGGSAMSPTSGTIEGALGPENPQPLPEGSEPQNIPTEPVGTGGSTTQMYEQQQPAPTGVNDAWTYEQTWIDPFIKQNLMQRDPVQLQSTMADIAAGQMSPVVQQQRERAIQQALSAAAGARGMPTAATHRAMTQQMGEADRSAMEAAAQQQLQAGQQVDEMARADAQINAQLEQQRDSMLDSLVGRGVDRNVALAQVNSEMQRLKEDLTYKYWAGRLGSTTEVIKQGIEHADFLEGGVESVGEYAPVINMLMGAATPEGYGVPTQRMISDWSGDPNDIFTATTTGGAAQSELVWNHETQSWELQQGAPTEREHLGVQDFGGGAVSVYREWNPQAQRWEYSFDPSAPGHEMQAEGEAGWFNTGESQSQQQAEEDDAWIWGF